MMTGWPGVLGAMLIAASTLPAQTDARADEFGEAELDRALRTGEFGVIYLWSPHMPFSVEGIAAIRTAAGRRGLAVTLVLHSHSDPGFSRRAIDAVEIEGFDENERAAALRPLAATTLLERGMTNHAPSIQLYGAGTLIGPVLPGARGVDGYLEFIDGFAQEAAR